MPVSPNSNYGPVGAPTAINPLQGVTGAHGDCLGFFAQLQKCYVESDVPERECVTWREDYVECKMHLKEKARLKRIDEERRRKQL